MAHELRRRGKRRSGKVGARDEWEQSKERGRLETIVLQPLHVAHIRIEPSRRILLSRGPPQALLRPRWRWPCQGQPPAAAPGLPDGRMEPMVVVAPEVDGRCQRRRGPPSASPGTAVRTSCQGRGCARGPQTASRPGLARPLHGCYSGVASRTAQEEADGSRTAALGHLRSIRVTVIVVLLMNANREID
ncbi:hypothetical protein ABZP36_022962 [Zizania latifolia]